MSATVKNTLVLFLLIMVWALQSVNYHAHMPWEFAIPQGLGSAVLCFTLTYGLYLLLVHPVLSRIQAN